MMKLKSRIIAHPPNKASAWAELYQEIENTLHQILSYFKFITEYDLLYIVGKAESGYYYNLYMGEHLTKNIGPLTTSQPLREGWCYLKKIGQNHLLEIHPLLIFWEDEMEDTAQISEVVVFDSYEKQNALLWYSHSKKEKVKTLKDEIVNLFDQFYYAKLKAIQPKRITSELEWDDLKYLAEKVLKQRQMDAARFAKYDPDLYLQRDVIWQTYLEFLHSDKSCLILIGPSGVGKSNFVFSVIDESLKTSSSVCALAYNGLDQGLIFEEPDNHIHTTNKSAQVSSARQLEDVLIQDFNKYLVLQQYGVLDGLAVLKILDNFMNKHEGKLVIIVDAINENKESNLLLKEINRFVKDNPYPWLKFIITSRPESWDNFRKGIELSETKYFRQKKEDTRNFNSSSILMHDPIVPIGHFSIKKELPLVYEKYRKKYDIETLYEHIPNAWKEYLSDPLALRLVSEITEKKHDGHIPLDIPFDDLTSKYVDMLATTARLESRDLDFLNQELLPRLFHPPEYPNQLLRTDLRGEKTTNGRSLDDLLFNYDEYVLGDANRRVNESFINLADNIILAKSEYAVYFQYERFYEYFGGIYLKDAATQSPDPVQFYQELGDALEQKPYLWGAVKNAFKRELKRNLTNEYEYQLIANIISSALSNRRLFRKAILDGLEEFSKENEHNFLIIKRLVGNLIEPCHGPAHSIGETLRRLVYHSRYNAAIIEPRQSIAIETAGRLSFEDILANTATDRIGAIRNSSILQIFRLWQRDREVGYRIINNLSQYAVARMGIPDIGVIESLT